MAHNRNRYKLLVEYGFLPWEADELDQVSLKVPYFKDIMHDRYVYFHKCIDKGWTWKKYVGAIKRKYSMRGWKTQGQYDPWKLLRSYEDRYKDKNPDYKSPWIKKQKRLRDNQEEIKRQLANSMDVSMKKVAEQIKMWRQSEG